MTHSLWAKIGILSSALPSVHKGSADTDTLHPDRERGSERGGGAGGGGGGGLGGGGVGGGGHWRFTNYNSI